MADILIRGMEMPKAQHTITITICHDGYTVVEYRDNGLLLEEIETYKTIPLPAGHGRLVDADKLTVKMKTRKWMIGRASDPDCLVFDAPTIVPAEEGRTMADWISVKDRLPEIWVKVLSFQPTFDEDCHGMIRGAVYIGNGKWRETEHHEMMELPVTHWLPLPEPPKEVEDGND
jgi:hypothetical protein